MPAAKTIGQNAFLGCNNLTSLSLPAMETIASGTFRGYTNLTSISLPAAATIGGSAFGNCTSLASISLPAATTIESSAFEGCIGLTSVSLPAATTIGANAFSGCTGLTSISLPAATTIGGNTFSGCTGLTSISLPAVTTIESGVFQGCTTLKVMIARADSPITTAQNAFSNVPDNILFVTTKSGIGSMFTNTTGIINSRILQLSDTDFDALTSAGPYVVPGGASVTLANDLSGTVTNPQWYKDGGTSPIATTATYTPTASGVYQMTIDYNSITYPLPSIRVIVGGAAAAIKPAGSGSPAVRSEDFLPEATIGRRFTLSGSTPVSRDVTNPFSSGVTVANDTTEIMISGTLPEELGAYPFVITATNEYSFWRGLPDALLIYCVNVTLTPSYTVEFETNGGSAVGDVIVSLGDPITRPADPTKNGHTFDGWYKESALNTLWSFPTDVVDGNMTLYAKWAEQGGSGNGGGGGGSGGSTPSSNTTPTKIVVTIDGTEYPAEKQPEGGYLALLPAGTDPSILDSLPLTVTLPTGATITPDPSQGVDFSNGPVKFTITAQNGTTKTEITIEVRIESDQPIAGALILTNPSQYLVFVTYNTNGTLSFEIRLPVVSGFDLTTLDGLYAYFSSALTGLSFGYVDENGNLVTLRPRSANDPYIRITGTAASKSALESATLSGITYWLKNSTTEYRQTFTPAIKISDMQVTYTNNPPTSGGDDEDDEKGGSSGGGCDAGALGLYGAALLCGAIALRRPKKRG